MNLEELYEKSKGCSACGLRAGCQQVLGGVGQVESPKLLIIGEAPDQEEDEEGAAFIGRASKCLRNALRDTGVLDRSNTLLTYVLKCRPPGDKFPKAETARICMSLWLDKEIALAKPARMLLLGNVPLKHVANKDKVTLCRGHWYDVKGIRTMVTFHPKYVLRQDSQGDMYTRQCFESDIEAVAKEVQSLLAKPVEAKA